MEMDRANSLMSENDSQKIEIFFSGRNLADLDLISVTDSYLKVYVKQTNKPKKQVLQTKVYWNDLNPDYAETLVIQYFFQIRQTIIVQVFHKHSPPKLLGSIQTSIGQIFGSRMKGLKRNITNKEGKSSGELILKCEKIERGNNKFCQFIISTQNLKTGSMFLCFGQTKAMFRLYKIKQGQQFLLYQSDFKHPQSQYKKIKINQKRLCNNNLQQHIIIKFYSESQIVAPIFIGQAHLTLQALIKGKYSYQLKKKKSEGIQKFKGICVFQDFVRYKKYQFTDYLMSGMQIALTTCIDFTASNQNPTHITSLHHFQKHKKSQYQQALQQTSKIVMDYDTDKLVPVYGFGAKLKMPNLSTGAKVHHCFPINGCPENPNLFQVEGIMQGYRACMKYLQFAGPTIFSPLLRQAMQACEEMKKQRKQYMLLLILTDGQINDIQEVKDLLVKCGRLPLSIIIIGIGDSEDWGLMNELDDDDCLMTDLQGNKTERDLVQFVEFKKFKNNGVELAREVLEEFPRQVEEYHQLCNLTPQIYNNDILCQMQKQNSY